jgi:hypothetical protein
VASSDREADQSFLYGMFMSDRARPELDEPDARLVLGDADVPDMLEPLVLEPLVLEPLVLAPLMLEPLVLDPLAPIPLLLEPEPDMLLPEVPDVPEALPLVPFMFDVPDVPEELPLVPLVPLVLDDPALLG